MGEKCKIDSNEYKNLLNFYRNRAIQVHGDNQVLWNSVKYNFPLDNNLGFCYVVPYKGFAQFQIGWRGYVQLAQRTGQYLCIS